MRNLKVNYFKTYHLLYYFVAYSFVGWCIETVYILIKQGKYVSRGLLNSPICPIYGFGALLILLLLYPLKDRVALFFLSSVLLCTGLEFISGCVLRTAFNRKFWDYSHEFLNVNGIICLKVSFAWGVAALIVIKLLHPYIRRLVTRIPSSLNTKLIYAILIFLFIGTASYITSMAGIKPQLQILNWLALLHE